LLRQIWQRGQPPSPSLAAVTTRSLPALREFLDGERALAADRWEDARLAFRSAIAADSTFWLAYFRYALAEWWSSDPWDEPEILEALRLHRQFLPERERLLVEALLATRDSVSLALKRYQQVAARFPEYWPAWFLYGDWLYHAGSERGHDWTDAVAALHRAVALEPNLVPAWIHIWEANVGKDPAEAARIAGRLAKLGWPRPDQNVIPLIQGVDRANGLISPELGALADSLAGLMASERGEEVLHAGYLGMGLLRYGFPAAQIDLNNRALRSRPVSFEIETALRAANARTWAARGQWDSALTIMAETAAKHPGVLGPERGPVLAVESYGLAVVGAWIGATAPHLADQRRPAALRAIGLLEDDDSRHNALGRLAYFDGVLAFARGDRPALLSARRDAIHSGYYLAKLVDQSLAQFELAQTGERKRVGHELAALDSACLEGRSCNTFTPDIAVQQTAAAQWLVESGETDRARVLLRWIDAQATDIPPALNTLVYILSGPNYLIRARLEKAHGDPKKAEYYYRQFLRRYDQPMASQVHLVEEARAALVELSGISDPPN
jgi:tetratricopeptide (TPR) repeat protein